MIQKTIISAVLFLVIYAIKPVQAQQSVYDSLSMDRINKNKTSMTILAAWAGINIIQSSILSGNAQGSSRYFFQMNTYWNLVNMGIAAYGLVRVKKELSKKYGIFAISQEQQKLEKLLLLNSGFDVAYIATGLYLKERGQRVNSDQLTGFGNGLLLQGSFLLIFDLIQYGSHRKNGKLLETELGKLQFTATGNGLGLTYHFK